MSLANTLEALKKKIADANKGGGSFLRLDDGDQYRIRFRQELAKDGKNYNEEDGTALVIGVHTSPIDFKKSAACTIENKEMNFKCWACEQVGLDRKWRAQSHLMVNVGVYDKDSDKWETKILDQKFFKSHISATLVEYGLEYETITSHEYKISRSGSKLDTNYTLIPVGEKDVPKELAEQDLHDLNTYRVLDYEKQEQYFTTVTEEENSETNKSSGW